MSGTMLLVLLHALSSSVCRIWTSNPHPMANTSATGGGKRRWSIFVILFIVVVVIAEFGFVGDLDMDKNVDLVEQWTTSVYFDYVGTTTTPSFSSSSAESVPVVISKVEDGRRDDDECRDWLEKQDSVNYSRDFKKEPILVSGNEEDRSSCSVGCKFGHESARKPDAAFGLSQDSPTASVHRSMESSHYYHENNIDQARRRGYKVVMTTSLSSDVPVGYFSWAEYDMMAPVLPKTEEALAAAFISNCGARNFRLQALDKLGSFIKIDSYGSCHRNRNGNVNKVDTLKRYKFSLAFENSNEEDYVTEKFFQSLVTGCIPVVIGAPNILEFAPSNGSILHIRQMDDVEKVANTMKHLAVRPDAFNQSLRWKYEGPSDSFKALVDMAAVHSSCRLCIHLATNIREKEEARFQNRPCKCTSNSGTIYHLYVRERGRFEMESIFLRSSHPTMKALESTVLSKFKSLNHVPIWKKERPESIRGGNELKIYRIYPVGLTQRQALYTFRFNSDSDLQKHIQSNPCAKFEVIFV